jgi:hypothetical protein
MPGTLLAALRNVVYGTVRRQARVSDEAEQPATSTT